VDERYHAEAGSACSIVVLFGVQPGIKNEQRLIAVQDPAQKSDHLFLCRLLIARIVRPARLIALSGDPTLRQCSVVPMLAIARVLKDELLICDRFEHVDAKHALVLLVIVTVVLHRRQLGVHRMLRMLVGLSLGCRRRLWLDERRASDILLTYRLVSLVLFVGLTQLSLIRIFLCFTGPSEGDWRRLGRMLNIPSLGG